LLFTFDVKVPANTPKTSPKKVTLKLKKGVLTKVVVLIPDGHQALAHLRILDGATPVIPWGEDQWIHGNRMLLDWYPNYELAFEPAGLVAVGYNEDDTYPHTFYLYMWVEKQPTQPDWRLFERAARAVLRLVERLLGG